MALAVERLVDGPWALAPGVGGNHGDRPLGRDGLAQVVGVEGGVGDDRLGVEAPEHGMRLGDVVPLPGAQAQPDRAAKAADGDVDLRAQAAA